MEMSLTANRLPGFGDTPKGAVFHRCALQVNPFEYGRRYRGIKSSGDPESHARGMITKASELGISVLAITDHNDFKGVGPFRKVAKGHDITIFPGFEVSSSEGIHVLCIYPPDMEDDHLARFLGELGIREPGSSTTLSDKTFLDLLATVRDQGGITIAAHVTSQPGGLLEVLNSGQARIRAWQSQDLLAVQIPKTVDELHASVQSIIRNENPQYRRSRTAGGGFAVAPVNAKDIVRPEDLADRAGTCLIKMSRICIEGLRQAFLDPGSRIQLNPPSPGATREPHTEMLGMAWKGGFLDGTRMPLNPNLNVLIGGRGAGKSTVIESLRYVLGLNPIGEDAVKAHQGIVRNVLQSGTRISLLVRTRGPGTQDYLIERTVPNPPIVRDQDGGISNRLPRDVLPRVEIYGQHEIAQLTRSAVQRTRLLDRFVEQDASLERRKAEIRQDLKKTRQSILEVRRELEDLKERLAALPGLEETLDQYRKAGLEERLRDRSLLVREEQVLDSIADRMEPLRECLESLRQELPLDLAFLSPGALGSLPGKDILALGNRVLAKLSGELQELASEFREALRRADESIAQIKAKWENRRREVQEAYEALLRGLERSAVHGEEFIRLRRRIERLRPLRRQVSLAERAEAEQMERRGALLTEWEELKAEEFRLLGRAAKAVTERLEDRIRVEVVAVGDRTPLSSLLREEIGGNLAKTIETLESAADLTLTDLADTCREGSDAILAKYDTTPKQAHLLANASQETLMRVEELDLPHTTEIQLNLALAGKSPSWRALNKLSTGQKATAVLLLLLLESDAPLIVDQPEDDLDNRFITEGIVPRMREEKRHRQFIFSTHNANIPVLGDAELILGLTPVGEAEEGRARIAREHMGSIDDQLVRELIEDLLEGGKDAFEKRRHKYGF